MDDTNIKTVGTFDRLTANAKKVINKGYTIAKDYGHSEFLIIHIFLSLLESKSPLVEEVLNKVNIDTEETKISIKQELSKLSKIATEKIKKETKTLPMFSEQIKTLINEGYIVSSEMNQVYVGTEHIFLAMFRMKSLKFIDDMKKLGINYSLLKKNLQGLTSAQSPSGIPTAEADPFNLSGMLGNDSDYDDEDDDSNDLPFFCRDMNEMAAEGKLSNITGRDAEIKRLIHILSRKTKNNPILVGDAGVGKTAIVEGLVNRILRKDVPSSLFDKTVLSVDVASIVAGAKLRGDVEERINYIINKAIEDGNTVLFIDEIHNIVGAGSVGGKDSMDIANILKPYLTTSELIVIGATTADEYNRYFESDSALSRRFQPITVAELDKKSAMEVMKNLRQEFEKYHNVKITPEAIEEAVNVSDKFIKDRYLPDKAIDLIDEAAASVKIGREIAIEPELSKLGEKLMKIQEEKSKAVAKKDIKKAAELKDKEANIVTEIAQIVEGKKQVKKKYPKTVTPELVKQIVVEWTKIPIAASDITDKTLKNLNAKLRERIIGQNHVIENVALAIQRSHIGLVDSARPLGSFLFMGPTGVGKTELAKTLAKELFGAEDLMYQVDMSEFMELHSVSKLIGSPPGYVGYQEGGQLTTFVRRKPYSVILFDEIEKAHPDTLNILLQVLEEGALTDAQGTKVSFSNTIIIMTSNIGADEVSKDNRLGFDVYIDSKEEKKELDEAYEKMRDRMIDELRNTLRPEFLNRIDLIDVFKGLNKEDTMQITKIRVQDLKMNLLEKALVLEVDDSVINKINEEGYSKEYGGRNIRRKVQEILENGLATYLIGSNITRKKNEILMVTAKVKDEKVVFEKTK